MTNYKTKIKQAQNGFELSCIHEDVRNAYFNKRSIKRDAYEARLKDLTARRAELAEIL